MSIILNDDRLADSEIRARRDYSDECCTGNCRQGRDCPERDPAIERLVALRTEERVVFWLCVLGLPAVLVAIRMGWL